MSRSEGNSLSQERIFGSHKSLLVPWDMSKKPSKNKREDKLGEGDGSRAIAFLGFSLKTLRAEPADGVAGGVGVTSFALLEPDNWVLRLHTEKGRGQDAVWAHRLIVDHDNKAWKRESRGTQFIDQCDEQTWADGRDLFWIVDLKTTVDDKELHFTGAGFLGMIQKGVNARKTRGALANNLAKNAGYVTDGSRMGQWWHIFTFPDPGFKVPTPTPGGQFSRVGNTVAAPTTPGQTTAAVLGGPCKPPEKTELMLRREAKWFYPDKGPVIPPILENPVGVADVGTIPVPVHFYVDSDLGNIPILDMKKDDTSNHQEIERKKGKPIKAFVLLPESEDVIDPEGSTVTDGGLSYPKLQYDDEDVGTSGFSTSTPTHSGSSGTSSEPMQCVALPVVIPP